jgi:hypothetical protein
MHEKGLIILWFEVRVLVGPPCIPTVCSCGGKHSLAAQVPGTDEASGSHSSARVSASNGKKQALCVFQHPFPCDLEVG